MTATRLYGFVSYVRNHIREDEKSKAQSFLNRWFRAFGHKGAIASDLRHPHGIHFTSEVDIRQIVRPTISDYWEEKINAANTISELRVLQLELQSYRVLDPACG